MEFILKESQLKLILSEESEGKITNYVKELDSFSKNIIKDIHDTLGLNFKLLLTWGPSVAGLVAPLDNFITNGNFNLTHEQTLLILSGIIAIHFLDNKKTFNKIYKKIKEEKISSVFSKVLLKSDELKKSFIGFFNSLGGTIKSISDLISYSFLIPIVTDILNMSQNTGDIDNFASSISKRIIASGLVTISFSVLKNLIKKMVLKLK